MELDTPTHVEATLIARAQAQDDTAFDQIVRLYADRIYNYVRRMVGNPQDAEDITQEVFLRAYQGLSQFDGACQLQHMAVSNRHQFVHRS
jgi:RNA polymerase sigma-70 factor (ECF subfamily)